MEEMILCRSCNAEFHQGFLSAHVEAFHVKQRLEDSATLSCLSCSFSVPLIHKDSMIQHCFVRGHLVSNVESQFHGSWLKEHERIRQILEIGYEILNSNLRPKTVDTPLEEEDDNSVFQQNATSKAMKKETPSIYKATEPDSLLNFSEDGTRSKAIDQEDEDQKENNEMLTLSFNTAADTSRTIDKSNHTPNKEVKTNTISKPKRKSKNKQTEPECLTCKKCFNTIKISGTKAHRLSYVAFHAMSHIPSSFKPYNCVKCTQSFKRKNDANMHVRKIHNASRPYSEHYQLVASEEDSETIKYIIEEAFPTFGKIQTTNIFAYV